MSFVVLTEGSHPRSLSEVQIRSIVKSSYPRPLINKPPPLNRDYTRDPHLRPLKGVGLLISLNWFTFLAKAIWHPAKEIMEVSSCLRLHTVTSDQES